jgi:DNA segregation ATPase FtsK/SpoIIIE, S-DNA-T family
MWKSEFIKGILRLKNKSDKTKPFTTCDTTAPFLVLSIFLTLSLISFAFIPKTDHWLGLIGYSLGWLLHTLFGLASYVFVASMLYFSVRKILGTPLREDVKKVCFVASFIVSLCFIFTAIEKPFPKTTLFLKKVFYKELFYHKIPFHLGGAPLTFLYRDIPFINFSRLINYIGTLLIFVTLAIFSLLGFFEVPVRQIIKQKIEELRERRRQKKKEGGLLRYVKVRFSGWIEGAKEKKEFSWDKLAISPKTELNERPKISPPPLTVPTATFTKIAPTLTIESKAPEPKALENPLVKTKGSYQVPSKNLLSSPKSFDPAELKLHLKRQAEILEETLASFSIEAKVGQINCGPTITSFEVHPAVGVKVQKIKSLEKDIALNLEAQSIRILAPIPGKAAIGIEVPNPHPQEVSFKEILNAYNLSGKKLKIPLLLGKTVHGEYVINDLTKMPHLIIAGATGSGKSVCINTIVMSILLNAGPDEIKFIMVDPKKVELTPYSRLPHMLAPVITEPKGACAAMQWLVKEMEKRYEFLKQLSVRNIEAFNSRKVDPHFEESLEIEIPEKLPYIVCIIDELADLMMVSSNEIETYIARIAQMARAVGIHLILATQRPSREVITGLIKANFPTRIAFKVSSKINSQIILDDVGAETLLGNGDMLFLPPSSSHLIRAQGAFIRDEDIHRVINKSTEQSKPNYVISSFDDYDNLMAQAEQGEEDPADPLYQEAYSLVAKERIASTTYLQRRFKIGYARAASLMDALEERGAVSSADGSKPRKVLIKKESDDDSL